MLRRSPLLPLLLCLCTFLHSPALLCLGQSEGSCVVLEHNSRSLKECRFPFVLNDVTYNSCTGAEDPEGRLWCSTRTGAGNAHIGSSGFWGFCPDNCTDNNSIEVNSNSNINGEDPDAELVSAAQSLLADLDLGQRQGGNCPCVHYAECPPIVSLVDFANRLARTSPTRRRIKQTLSRIKCSRPSRAFQCCQRTLPGEEEEEEEEKEDVVIEAIGPRFQNNGTSSEEGEEQGQEGSGNVENSKNRTLGTWKPSDKECGIRTKSLLIRGGEQASVGEFPFMVLLGYQYSDRVFYTCGGTLINKLYVLTAAHCHNNPRPIKELIFGELDLARTKDCSRHICAPPVQKRFPEKVVFHPDWDARRFTEGNDIALVRVDKPVVLFIDSHETSFVVPVCLPWQRGQLGRNPAAGAKTVVTGWGRVTNDNVETHESYKSLGAATSVLNKLTVAVQDDGDCVQEFRNFNPRTQVCSGGVPGQDSCGGDSGGPLLIRNNTETPWFQVGVVSYGTRICGIGKPGVYTKVAPFLPWIEQSLEP